MSEATLVKDASIHDYVPAAAVAAGEVLQMADGRACVVAGLQGAAANERVAVKVSGRFKVAAASGAWSRGDEIWWDASANNAVVKSAALDGDADFYLGIADAAKGSSDTTGVVELNAMRTPPDLAGVGFEFDCENGGSGDTSDHTLIPAEANPNGLVILLAYAIVTEVFGGASEDQGIVTVEDSDDNSLSVITATNAGADAVGDVLIGTNKLLGGASGDAIKTVAAGKAITARVSQQTSGASKAGKMKVYLLVAPLV